MSPAFWIKRFVTVFIGAFALIGVAQAIKGLSWYDAAGQGAVWGAVSATVFTVARFFQARRGQHCAICKDTPEMQRRRGSDA